jgi:UDP-N-acetylenolpyruvoylglucosamine reductase
MQVSGEDDALTNPMRDQLLKAGVRLCPMTESCQLVVCSSAISHEHPASRLALSRGLPLVRRGELLAELCKTKKLVAVCGSHGKTTTTAMLVTALRLSGFPFGYVLGGLLSDESIPPARADAGDWIVAEIDESDGTIGCFSPEIAVPTNLEWDHPDYYRSEQSLTDTFAALFARTRGTVLINETCVLSSRLLPSARRARTIGPSGDFSFRVESDLPEGLRLQLSESYGIETAFVRARGAFNAANAAAALAAASLMGACLSPGLLSEYSPVRRRQEYLLRDSRLTVIGDYAHHPSEIRALLRSLKAQVPEGKRLFVVFQPHRFSRTFQFKRDFAEVLQLADELHLLDVYPAGEAPLEGATSRDIFEALPESARVRAHCHGGDFLACFAAVEAGLRPGDWLAVVGAGNVDQMARQWLARRGWSAVAAELRSLVSASCTLNLEEPLAPRTTLGVGGAARLFAEPANSDDLCTLVTEAARRSIPWFVLGRGSNVLVPDEGVDGLVISLSKPAWSSFEHRSGGLLWVGAGLRLKNLCGLAAKEGLRGFEFLEGIPGTVGGALRMNAGAMKGWIFDVVEEVQFLTREGSVNTLPKGSLHYDYRHCVELEQAVALGALLRPRGQGTPSEVVSKIEEFRSRRQLSQPREPSAGCMFKNPEGDSAGRLIDSCGLKGESVGDAEVSGVHANFIVNRGDATASDIIALVRRVRSRVQQTSGILLEPEVLLLGKSWSSVL